MTMCGRNKKKIGLRPQYAELMGKMTGHLQEIFLRLNILVSIIMKIVNLEENINLSYYIKK